VSWRSSRPPFKDRFQEALQAVADGVGSEVGAVAGDGDEDVCGIGEEAEDVRCAGTTSLPKRSAHVVG
jgi:hypothetical protein